jgi:hypothetical protein
MSAPEPPASAPPPDPAGAFARTAPAPGRLRTPISAVLIVKDGEAHLERVLEALAWCDDLLVLDSGSRDRTLEIARERGARIAHQDFLGYGRQKQRAVDLARFDWVLVVDADEVLDAEATRAIRALDLSDPTRCWRLRRRTYIGAREVRHGQWTPDYSLRLFNRTRARFDLVAVHEAVRPGGEVLTLPGALHHYSYRDHAEVFTRLAAYARLKSWDYRQAGRRASAPVLVLRAFWGFFRSYVIKRGFLDGGDGVIVAMSLALDCVLGLVLAEAPLLPGSGPGGPGSRPPSGAGSAVPASAPSEAPAAAAPAGASSTPARRTGWILEPGAALGLPEPGEQAVGPDEEAILRYLETGTMEALALGNLRDPLTGEEIDGTCAYSDGVWSWPSYLVHFRRRHRVRLEAAFLAHIRDRLESQGRT